jgi:hypothetical protein
MQRDLDNLTPLDARNSLLMDPTEYKGFRGSFVSPNPLGTNRGYDPVPNADAATLGRSHHTGSEVNQSLLMDAASMGHHERNVSGGRSVSPAPARAPRLPEVDLGTSYGRAM